MVNIHRSGFGQRIEVTPSDQYLIENIESSDDIYFQVLFIESPPELPTDHSGDQVTYRLCTKQKKSFDESVIPKYPKSPGNTMIRDLLPSEGVEFPDELCKELSGNFVRIANFYNTARCLLQTRKISQLIARSWWAHRIYTGYLNSGKENPKFDGQWTKFLEGMDSYLKAHPDIVNRLIDDSTANEPNEAKVEETALDILDGLIARDIFLTANASAIGIDQFMIDEGDLPIYNAAYLYPQTDGTSERPKAPANTNDRMLILPNSRCWNGIRLALLLAGQAFRKEYKGDGNGNYVCQDSCYHQICQSIMSTSEIVSHYLIEASMESFHGQIEEIPMGLYSDLPYLKTKIPYPPIPGEEQIRIEELEEWFLAEDEDPECPFFIKNPDGKYTTGIQNPTPPYPYIPISTS